MYRDQIAIRKASHQDALALSNLICDNAEALLKPHYSPEQWKIFLTYYSEEVIKEKIASQQVFCAVLNDEIVGTIALDKDFVVGFYTHIRYVNQGIGTMLMKHIEEVVRQNGLSEIQLAASPVGLAFYYKNGWAKVKDILMVHYGVAFEETLMRKGVKN